MLKAGHQFQDCASFLTCLAWGFIKNISKQKLHETFHFPILKEHPLSSTFMNDSSTFLKWISFPLSSTFHFPILSYFQNLQNLPENRRPFFRVKFSTSVSHWGTQKVAPGNYGEITICHYNSVYIYTYWLVVSNPSEKYDIVKWDYCSQSMEKYSKPPTSISYLR